MRGSAPKISVVTPNFNGGRFLEETIESVLDQDYPNVEYIVCDGGSTDDSVPIIRKHERRLAKWVSEPDKGQTDAINKGLRMATGEVLAFLNSDDLYRPGALRVVAEAFRSDHAIVWLGGACDLIDLSGKRVGELRAEPSNSLIDWLTAALCAQPATFLRRTIVERMGPFRKDLHYSFDHEYWVRLVSAGHRLTASDGTLAAFRLHQDSKTYRSGPKMVEEDLEICRLYESLIKKSDRGRFDRLLRTLRGRRALWSHHETPIRARLALIRCALAEPRMLMDWRMYWALKTRHY